MDTAGSIMLACICIIHIIPLFTLALTAYITAPSPNSARRARLARRRNRGVIYSHFEELLRLNNPAVRRFLGKYALAACTFHVVIITIFILALQLGVTPPFVPKLSTLVPEDVLDRYTKFSIACGVLQMLPISAIIFFLYYHKRLPFMSASRVQSKMTKADLSSVEELAEDFGSIRLSRYEDSRKTIIFANCKDYRSGRLLKLALSQDKDNTKKTECFRINKRLRNLVKLNPSPIQVDDLEKAFDAAQ